MSNALNRTLASVLVAAAAATGGAAATAQTSREDAQQQARQRVADCYNVGKEKGGVEFLPLTNKGYQQDREKLLGCLFNKGANEEFIVTQAYDLADPKQATAYGNTVTQLQKTEQKAAEQLARQGGRVDQNGNIIQEAGKTARDANKTVTEANRTVNETKKFLKNFGIKF